ncbi:hypothetical protein CIK05_01530 [Bdellovibrio sp. qaytius]|nr:hypothetical protein CIK05_01530 [Bdellovibrio sp. qaytius]
MNKTHKKAQRNEGRPDTRADRKTTGSRSISTPTARIKEFSKKVLHDYVIPMTRIIEHRLLRLEQSL